MEETQCDLLYNLLITPDLTTCWPLSIVVKIVIQIKMIVPQHVCRRLQQTRQLPRIADTPPGARHQIEP